MKREDIEKAAKDYSIGLKEVDADDYVLRKDNCREDFMAGAESFIRKKFDMSMPNESKEQ